MLQELLNGGWFGWVVLILVVVVAVILILSTIWKRIPQNKAAVVTGWGKKRIISGGGGLVIPMFQRYDVVSLENIKIPVDVKETPSSMGVPISVSSVAVVKIRSNKEAIYSATEQFYRGSPEKTSDEIATQAGYVLMGKLREIVATLTVEEIFRDKEKFSSAVQENAAVSLAELGLEIKAFTVREIRDSNGYLEALGRSRIAEVKRDAQIAEAEAERETVERTAEATRKGAEARLMAETQVAEASKKKELQVQAFRKEELGAKAEADNAYLIRENQVKKEVTQTELEVEILRAQRATELAEQEALRKEKELEATVNKQADAEHYRQQREADAKKYSEIAKAEAAAAAVRADGLARAEATRADGVAKAEAIKAQGMAEAETIEAKGLAEAKAMAEKAEAFKQYNEAAVIQMMIEKLPEIAHNVAQPMSKTEKIVVIDQGNGKGGAGASKVAGYVTDIMAQLPDTIEALTGMNPLDLLKKSNITNAFSNNPEKKENPEVIEKLAD